MRILVDLDSITADLLSAWLSVYNKDYNDHLTVKDVVTWDTHKVVKPACGKKIYDYLKRPGFFRGLRPLPGAQKSIKALHAQGHQIYITTAAPDGSATEKVHWVDEHLPFLDAKRQTVVCTDKEIIDADILIDDSPRNLLACKAARPKMHTISIAYPYNYGIGDYRALAWDDTETAWEDILRYIGRIGKPTIDCMCREICG